MGTKKSTSPLDQLSAREREVLKLIAEGRSSKEIAVILGLKLSSVHTYRSRVMAKLARLVRLAIRHRLIKP